MKNTREYNFTESIESIDDVVNALRKADFDISTFRKCDLEGKTIDFRILIHNMALEYEVVTVDDCLKFIVNNAVILGELIKMRFIVEG